MTGGAKMLPEEACNLRRPAAGGHSSEELRVAVRPRSIRFLPYIHYRTVSVLDPTGKV